MFPIGLTKRVSIALVLAASLVIIPALALAHGSNVKIHDDARNQTWEVGYGDVTVNSNGTVSFWGTTVCQGTITFSDGNFGAYYGYSGIPINASNRYYSNNSASLRHSNSPGYCGLSSGGGAGSGAGYQGGNNGGGSNAVPAGMISSDGAGIVSHDGGTIISHDAGSLITDNGGAFRVQSVGGRPAFPGSHNPYHFSCSPVVYVPPTGNYYYQARPTSHLLSAPRGGMYTCQSIAQRIGLSDGGYYR
jgi:hypothetical protein